jgi:hypothetical protein
LAGPALLVSTGVATVSLAVAAVVQERRVTGAVLAACLGSAAALVSGRGRPWHPLPRYGVIAMLVVTALVGPAVALASRLDPTAASGVVSKLPYLAAATAAGKASLGYVLRGTTERRLHDAELVRIRRGRLGSWVPAGSVSLPGGCRITDRIDGVEEPRLTAGQRFASSSGVFMSRTDFERVCYVADERVVVGFAPPGTDVIEAVTIAGEEFDIPIGVEGAYVVMLEEDTRASTFVRLSFRDARGILLDSKPVAGTDEYANFAYASGLIPRPRDRQAPAVEPVTVSRYILTPREYRHLCGEKAPYGDGFVGIAIVRRDDGETREVVVGNGMPFSSGHPRPDPPRVRRSGALPCFAV